jgi:hypothetical protein
VANADDEHVTFLDPIKDQMSFMPVNAIGPRKLSAHPVCLWESGYEPERLMQCPLIRYGLLLSELMQALPVDDLQIAEGLAR